MSRHHYLLNYIGALTAFLAFLSHDVAFSGYARPPQIPSPALVPLFSSFLLCKSSRKHLLARRLQAASKLTATSHAGDHCFSRAAFLLGVRLYLTLPLQPLKAVLGNEPTRASRAQHRHGSSSRYQHQSFCSYVLVTLLIYLSGMAGHRIPPVMSGYATALLGSTSTAVSGRSYLRAHMQM